MEYKYIGGIFTPIINDKLKIVTIRELLKKDVSNGELKIPGYQRPYRWSTESTLTLVMDTYEAFSKKVKEYRMGSVVLHKPSVQNNAKNTVFNIVDGQQRPTTISIIRDSFVQGKVGIGISGLVICFLFTPYRII
mgnify:FL=1